MRGDLNFPFEPCEPQELPGEDVLLTGGAVVMSAVVSGLPALLFRFPRPDGSGFHPPVLLAAERDELQALPTLVEAAVTRALEATS